MEEKVDTNINNIEDKKSFFNLRFFIVLITIFLLASLFVLRYIVVEYNAVPNIKLLEDETVYLDAGKSYNEPGVKATLNTKDITKKVKIDGSVDSSVVKNYTLTYSVVNNKGRNKREVKRTVIIKDKTKPVIKLVGNKVIKINIKEKFNDPGYSASDNVDGDITNSVEVFNKVNTNKTGSYEILYQVEDSSKNIGYAKRRIVVADFVSPILKLNGKSTINIPKNGEYTEPGYSASDNIDGDITDKVSISGKVKPSIAAVYNLKYKVSDSSGNTTYKTRTIYVGTAKERAGNNSIKISISSQHLYYYKNGETLVSTSVVTGQVGSYSTPKGTFRILGKSTNVTLRGEGYASFVNFWMPISSGGIGLHDASWRNGKFGGTIYKTNGSHGCINMPYWAAKKIFNNAPTGTPVYIY